MSKIQYAIQNHSPERLDILAAFIASYHKIYPGAKLFSAGFYTYSPGAANRQNAFLALDAEGQARGFAAIYPAPVTEESSPDDPHHIWMLLLSDLDAGDGLLVRKLLLEKIIPRAEFLAASFPAHRCTRLAADMMISQLADIAFLEKNGFELYDGMYVMLRQTSDLVPTVSFPGGLTQRLWKIESDAERQQYLRAFNTAFPGHPKSLASLQFLLDSPLWRTGTAVAAFDSQDELVASLLVYPAESKTDGITDDVFVLPAWRGRGIAKALIAKGLEFLHDHGYAQVILEVMQDNLPAVSVYQAMGYQIVNQEVFLGRFIKT